MRLTHWFNFLFLTLLFRSSLAILAAHPKLYWNVHSTPGSEWLKLSRKPIPPRPIWCSTDEEVAWPAWLTLPGGHGLGLGRYWHFLAAMGWVICGFVYVILLFISPQWRRLVPTSWHAIPEAFRDFILYATLRTPSPGTSYGPSPFNALQQLTYFGLVFALTPLQILTGMAQSPSLLGRFPWLGRAFGNRQAARSLHFLGLVGFGAFLVVHLVMVVWHGFGDEMGKMVLGEGHTRRASHAIGLGLGIVGAVVLLHVAANLASAYRKQGTHRVLSALVDPVRRAFLHRLVNVQDYPETAITPWFRINGYPPIAEFPQAQAGDDTYERLLAGNWADYQLEVLGAVEQPLSLTLEDLRAMPRQEQTTLHNCIQGWTSIGRWSGVRVRDLLALCGPRPEARYLAFLSFGFQEKPGGVAESTGTRYYECIDLLTAEQPTTIVAFELNGEPLRIEHGAPLRLRVETKLGFKMVKYLRAIEVVDDYRKLGAGMGGVREDEQQFDMGAEI
ncbi:MAG TPA: molybdopterin-dependent oxidoreductase [Isosphaeraceae bacterium]|nr:molybdopterin-dependent oxidoreductase [Isosphaeraceae bacterium]